MKLLLSVSLLWIFSISAEGLQCLSCTDSTCSTIESVTCSTETMCITASILVSSEFTLFRGCASSSLCSSKTFSLHLGSPRRRISAECCDTDNCNSQTLPSPTPQSPNDLQCFYCPDDDHCDDVLDCEGDENMCIQGNAKSGTPIRGCASANMCQAASINGELPFYEDLGELTSGTTCCDTDLCNNGLQCLNCTDSTCSTIESVTCSTETMCITASILDSSSEFTVLKGCASPSLCSSTGPKTFSVDLGRSGRLISADCCETDNCNSQTLPSPTLTSSPNGIRCLFCSDDDRCDVILNCQGEEDICIKGNAKNGTAVQGCVSAGLCQAASIKGELPFYEDLGELTSGTTCCDTDLCNDAEGLQCLSCIDSTCTTIESVTCSTETMCITASILDSSSEFTVLRGCASPFLCSSTGPKTFSVDLGRSGRLISADCCETDNCNSQTLPSPTLTSSPNGIRCLFCSDDDRCDVILDCQGEEDICIKGNAKNGTAVQGCVSAGLCQAASIKGELPFYEDLGELTSGTTCCDTDLCNDAEGLQCLSCTDSTCSTIKSVTCSTETMCITASILDSSSEFTVFRGCASPFLCSSTGPKTFSVDLGRSGRLISADCCETDNCNSQTLPSPTPTSSPNGIRCLFCSDDDRCDVILNCQGEEDICIKGNAKNGTAVQGCVSAGLCQAASINGELPFYEDLGELTNGTTCCDTDLCNDAEGLQCLSCTDSTCSTIKSVTCSTETMCITASILDSSSEFTVFRGCASPFLCSSTGPKTFSVDLGRSGRLISADCCETDNCNSQTLPSPTPTSSPNVIRCLFCSDDDRCDVILNCQGEEDICIKGNAKNGTAVQGCVSAGLCQAASIKGELPFYEDLGELTSGTTCCDTDLCNDGLQCLSCTDSTCSTIKSVTCSTETMCITASILETRTNSSSEFSLFRGCASSSLCSSTGPKTFSVDVGFLGRLISAECCDTDNCNSQTLPSPTLQSFKNLRCFFCFGNRCDLIVDCQGEEDRCIQGNEMGSTALRGCASASMCQAASDGGVPSFFEGVGELTNEPTCCTTELCNNGSIV
ncbi:protein psiR-like isoform X3 [Gouania willdenowi]|uniref:protein psiR-like isoform X3 n=1 Tax=Gouania willdenowi TaxID=441366 RepID=UPI001055B973|nr:protein psiR-like isoform X3 [Gouania willdenowi]